MKKYLIVAGLALATLSLSATAAPGGKPEQVLFAAGKSSKTVTGSVQGQASMDYLVTAKAGQSLSVSLKSGNASANFNVNSPGTELALFNGSSSGNTLKNRRLPKDGTYVVRVYLMGNAADSKQKVDFTLDIGVTGQALAPLADKMDAKVGKTPYHATADVPAKYYLDPKLSSCQAGVIRRGKDGTATVVLKMKGFDRAILFIKGQAVGSDSSEAMKIARKGDLTTVTFGDKSEVYEIRDVFLMGD